MGKIAFIFPGQGAQKTGMGQAFCEKFEVAGQIFEKASKAVGLDVKSLCFEANDLLDKTEYTQCALVTTELAIWASAVQYGLKADVSAGLSLGEYSALVAVGAMKAEDAIAIVRQRGILMEHEVPEGQGGMMAVMAMDASKIEEVIEPIDGVQIANYNCPGQIVISGRKEAVAKAGEALKEAGARRCIPLKVSGPFHSQMLVGAGEKLSNVLEPVELANPAIPYATNVTGAYVTDKNEIKELLKQQVSSSVRWQQCIETMIADGVDTFIEMGPGTTLTGFLKKINRGVKAYHIETPEDLERVVQTLKEDSYDTGK